MSGFDLDAYLGEPAQAPAAPAQGFNVDAYLSAPAPSQAVPPVLRAPQIQPQASPDAGLSTWEIIRNGLATAPINLYLGTKQMFGGLSPDEQRILQYNKETEQAHPGLALASNLATAAPTFFIPGVNSITGAGVVGAATGLLQPVSGDQTAGNIATGKLENGVIGGLLGSAGQFAGNKLSGLFSSRLASAQSDAATQAALNAPRDTALQAARDAGYQIPNSMAAPSFWTNRLESLAGKAATKQAATLNNQQVTNSIARNALGLAPDTPLSISALEGVRSDAGKAYQAVASLPPRPPSMGNSVMNVPADPGFNPAATLQTLKQARNDAQAWFNSYNRSANPEHLAAARSAQSMADNADNQLTQYAASQGRSDLLPALYDARRRIAQTYTVQRALNDATGDVSAPVLGQLAAKGKPLSGGLDTIGNTAAAFKPVMGNGFSTPAPGVSKSEALTAALLGTIGHASAGPVGAAAAALPLLSHAARPLALAIQNTPTYAPGLLTRGAAKAFTPEQMGLAIRTLTPYALPAQ